MPTTDIYKEAIMININDIKINQKVWFKEHWTERIVCGFVSEIAKRSDKGSDVDAVFVDGVKQKGEK